MSNITHTHTHTHIYIYIYKGPLKSSQHHTERQIIDEYFGVNTLTLLKKLERLIQISVLISVFVSSFER